MDFKILFESNNFLAIDKPAGVSVHGDGYSDEKTIADWVQEKYPDLIRVGEDFLAKNGVSIKKPGIVHRLDKETSGILLIAKNDQTFQALKGKFKAHAISKTYRAIVYGTLEGDKKQGTIDLPIGRSRKDSRKRLAGRGASSVLREALTYYSVLENFSEYCYLEAHPKTGRTHQLRVHFKAIGHPIVCDKLYAEGKTCLPGLERQALHAYSLQFDLNGQTFYLESPLPGDMGQALEKLKSM